MKRIMIATAVAACLLPAAARAQDDEGKCQRDLSVAAGSYLQCMEKAMGSYYSGNYLAIDDMSGRCVNKYIATWPRVVKKYAAKGTSCEGDRYVDNGDGTFSDRLTRLTWEKKDDSGGINDADHVYTWAAGYPWKETGTVFTTFLKTLNDGGFGGSSGWRLPSIYELSSLIEPSFPKCSTGPCTTAPGMTASDAYWSSSTNQEDANLFAPSSAWVLVFSRGVYLYNGVDAEGYVRAVRSGS